MYARVYVNFECGDEERKGKGEGEGGRGEGEVMKGKGGHSASKISPLNWE